MLIPVLSSKFSQFNGTMVHYKERVTESESYFNCAIESLYPPSIHVPCLPVSIPPSLLFLLLTSKSNQSPFVTRVACERCSVGWLAIWPFHFVASSALPLSLPRTDDDRGRCWHAARRTNCLNALRDGGSLQQESLTRRHIFHTPKNNHSADIG